MKRNFIYTLLFLLITINISIVSQTASYSDLSYNNTEKNIIISKDITIGSDISLYSDCSFSAESKNGEPITEYQWEYIIYTTDNNFAVVQTSTNPLFTITTPKTLPNEIKKNEQGNIVAAIYVKGKVNNVLEEGFLNVYISCEPEDIILDFRAIPYNEHEYMPYISVFSRGATAFTITMTDRTDGFSHTDSYTAVDSVKVYSFNIAYGNDIQIKVAAVNKFGQKTETFKIGPVFTTYTNNLYINKTYELRSLLNGRLIKTTNSREEILNFQLYNGLYLIVEKDTNGNTLKSEKLLIIDNP